MKAHNRILAIAVLFGGLAAWVIDALLDYVYFYEGDSLLDLLLWKVPQHEIYTRLSILGILLGFAVVANTLIRQREDVEEALRQSESEKATVLDSVSELVAYHDLNQRVIWANRAAAASVGQTVDDLIGRHCYAIWHNSDDICEGCPVLETLRTGQPESAEIVTPDGRTFLLSTSPVYDDDGELLGAVEVGRDITATKRAQAAVARVAEVNAALAELSRKLIEPVSIEDMSVLVLETAQRLTGSIFGYVGHIDPATGYLVSITMTRDIWDVCHVPDKSIVFKEFVGLWGWVLTHRQPLLTNDPAQDPRSSGTPPGHIPIERFLSAPAMLGDRLVGQIALANPDRDYTPDDLVLVERLAVIYALALRRARHEDAMQEYNRRLEVQREIDRAILKAESPQKVAGIVLQHLWRLVPYMRGSVVVLDPGGQMGTVIAAQGAGGEEVGVGVRVSLDEFGSGEQLGLGMVKLVDDCERISDPSPLIQRLRAVGVRSYLNVPLVADGQLIGTLNLASDQSGAFTSWQVRRVREVTDQLAIAIHQWQLRTAIQCHTDELEQRVAERTAELEAAYRHLQVLARVKDEFVSNVSHELKTPITNLKLRQYLLAAQPGQVDVHLPVLRRETERLEVIIENLLFLSRLDQGRVRLRLVAVDLNALAGQYASDRQTLAASHELTLRVDLRPGLPTVRADSGLLGEALSVLLTNALNYTPGGGTVTIHTCLDAAAGQVGFGVSDDGPGIPPEEHPSLFKRFFRGTAGLESGMSGTGLGLAIVQEIVERHQGHVEVVSSGVPGEGATFTIWLPLDRAAALDASPEALEAEQEAG